MLILSIRALPRRLAIGRSRRRRFDIGPDFLVFSVAATGPAVGSRLRSCETIEPLSPQTASTNLSLGQSLPGFALRIPGAARVPRCIRQYPMIDPNPLHERGEPRVDVQRVKHRVLREEVDKCRSILEGALEP